MSEESEISQSKPHICDDSSWHHDEYYAGVFDVPQSKPHVHDNSCWLGIKMVLF